MIDLRHRRIFIAGRPRILLCGEIHYFRLPRTAWQDRLDQLKRAGCDTVASYIPWLCHEPVEGRIDLSGWTRPELDLMAYIDLCRDNGLYFIARPGPFVMAEMKNEGLPYWLYDKHPEIVPVGWDGQPATTRTVDVLAPHFLAAVRDWYAAVMVALVPRLRSRGGNVIALQLDNEVGMLSWCSNVPELTEHTLADFAAWLARRYAPETLRGRYPFDLDDPATRAAALRSPGEAYAAQFMRDLGHYQRGRYARYLATLRAYAEAEGVKGIPFLVNVHGTGGGRGFTYPIGISQLYEAYTQAPGYLPGTDLYLGNLTPDNFQDLYLCNALQEASQTRDQPLCSLEFECGDGDYGQMQGNRYDPSAVDLKTRMCIAQGNRLLNYYLFAGGTNYRLDPPPGDGDDRIAITGERHGVAAPVKADGSLSYTYPRMARIIRTMATLADKLADMDEERDGLAYGFIPDYFMTEAQYPQSAIMREIAANVQANRAYGAWESMARGMLLAGYRFGAVDVQNRPLDPVTVPVLALPSARYMDGAVQGKLVAWLEAGGGLLLYGEVPLYDMEGRPCAVLAGALGVEALGTRHSSERHYLSLCAEGWAAPRPEVRTHFAQVFAPGAAEPLLRLYGGGEVAAFEAQVGLGRAVVIATAYPCDVGLFQTALERLGATAGLRHDGPPGGVFMTSMANAAGEAFVHVLNLDGHEQGFRLFRDGRRLLGGRELRLPGREGLMLPVNLDLGEVRIRYATAEVVGWEDKAIEFRCLQPDAVILLETTREFPLGEGYTLHRRGRSVRVQVWAGVERLRVEWL